jgi:4-hydroxythreonine-4-phosphate dehydrogenase
LNFLGSLSAKFVLYGSTFVLKRYAELLKVPLHLPDNLSITDVVRNVDFEPGVLSKSTGRAQFLFLQRAVNSALRNEIQALVTLPMNKKAVTTAGYTFSGHTEFLAKAFKVKNYAMMLATKRLKVVLLTTHIPIRKVPHFVTTENILSKLNLIARHLKGARIAVAGLNPHAGEGGLIGDEEVKAIKPAVESARATGIPVDGPLAPDTVFVKALKGAYDVVVCMFHDQGLIPVKLIDFEHCVNVTLGLPVVRTSVSHGTAYDIAGKGVASPESFKCAVRLALELLEKRQKQTMR